MATRASFTTRASSSNHSPAGRHIRWGKNYRVALVDTRKTLLQVAGQEVLSADNVGVKLSVVLTTQIADAREAERNSANSSLRRPRPLACRPMASRCAT